MLKIKAEKIKELESFGFKKVLGWNIYRKPVDFYCWWRDIKIFQISVLADKTISLIIGVKIDANTMRTYESTNADYIEFAVQDLIKADMIEEEL